MAQIKLLASKDLLSQLCINTSIVYMHRFYMFHSFKQFHRNTMAPCFIFLGAKVEEQPRKLEHVLKVAHKCLHKDSEVQLDLQSDEYMQMAQDLIDNESILLQTLGFDLSVEHPHTYVVKCAQMVKAAKELAQTSYFLATNSLHLTTFCIEEKPTVIACVCIYVACKWTSYEIPETHDKKRWWEYMDSNITLEKIEDMSSHFIKILDSCPTRLKKKISTGPVIYKGGTIQPKKDCDVEHGKFDKLIDNNANKTHSKVEGTSSRMGDHRPDKHSAVYNRHSDNQVEVRKDLHDTSQHLKKHAKHSSQSEHDKRNLEHHKHHKRKHSDHSKQQSEKPKSQESRAKRTEDVNHEKSDSLEMKASSSSRPLDGSKPKVSQSQSGSLSSAAKHILSLPPLHHKHSLPDTDGTSVGESPSKKQKVSMASGQKQKLDGEMDRIVSQTDDNTYIGTSSGSHKKPKPVIEKHKMRISSEKHAEMYRQMQRASDKSHGQKIHYDKHSKGKKVEHPKSSNAHGQGNIDSNSLKKKDEFVSSFKLREEVNQLSHDSAVSSQNPKQSAVPRKSSSSEKRTQKVSHSTPKKNGHSSKLTFKTGSVSKELSLPPPPPPPSFNVPNILAGQPPLPTDPDVKQKPAPAPPDDFEDSVAIQQSYIMSDGQVQTSVMQNQMQGQLYSVQDQATQNQQNQTLVPRDYQQQLFSSSAQSVNSSSNALTTPQLYYQGQDRVQAGTSDVSQAYWQSINSTSLFSPNNIGLLTQPPVPPQGLVIHQIDGLPPPPPPILPPFPPPPT